MKRRQAKTEQIKTSKEQQQPASVNTVKVEDISCLENEMSSSYRAIPAGVRSRILCIIYASIWKNYNIYVQEALQKSVEELFGKKVIDSKAAKIIFVSNILNRIYSVSIKLSYDSYYYHDYSDQRADYSLIVSHFY